MITFHDILFCVYLFGSLIWMVLSLLEWKVEFGASWCIKVNVLKMTSPNCEVSMLIWFFDSVRKRIARSYGVCSRLKVPWPSASLSPGKESSHGTTSNLLVDVPKLQSPLSLSLAMLGGLVASSTRYNAKRGAKRQAESGFGWFWSVQDVVGSCGFHWCLHSALALKFALSFVCSGLFQRLD